MKITEFENEAKQLDDEDPLKSFRDLFALPSDKIYLCNNSLGMPVKSAFTLMQEHMKKWSQEGAHGWFSNVNDWYSAHDTLLREPLAELLGAKPEEVAVMNSLTVNLHLLLTSFYRPDKTRFKILIEAPTFPSDLYAVKSHIYNQGFHPDSALIVLKPRDNESTIREEDIVEILAREGHQIALVFFSSVNYLTGQALDMERITQLAQAKGCVVGFNLAHAAGNIPLQLHKHKVDFAVGCSYKYLCSGPGGPGIAFVHTHHHNKIMPRLSGWWGNDPETRFQMDAHKEFVPHGGANSWQVSTPSILSMLPLISSLQVIQEAGMPAIRKKSAAQTTFLLKLLQSHEGDYSIVTPLNEAERGSQISIRINRDATTCLEKLTQQNVICDYRTPDIIRVTPSALYNSFQDIYQFACSFIAAL